MAQRGADLALVRKVVSAQGSGHYPESALTLLTEGLPFALPVPSTVGEGATAAVHKFQTRFLGHLEECFAEAKKRAWGDGAAAEHQIGEAITELEVRCAAEVQARGELDEAIAQVGANKAHIKELDAAVAKAEADHEKWEAKGSKQQKEWAKLRELHEASKAVDEGALLMLEGEEGDEDVRSAAASAVTAFIAEQNAEQVLQSAAPLALAVKPSTRGGFDRMTAEAVVNLVRKRVAELSEKLDSIAPAERNLRAEVVGLWAITDCARDALLAATEEVAKAELLVHDARKPTHEGALQGVQELQATLGSHEAAQAGAVAMKQELADASAALERLARPKANEAEEEVGEPDAKRQRMEEATS